MNTATHDTPSTASTPPPPRRRSRILRPLVLVPALGFLCLALLLAGGLTRNPRLIPSPLIGKPVPDFQLPPVQGRQAGLASTDLKGEVSLVNVFASWCVACRQEHPLLMEMARSGVVPIHGLNYKDEPGAADGWLRRHGDPYRRTGADVDGRVGIDWGVYGVPETFVIGADGRVAYKHVGPITPDFVNNQLLPLIKELRAAQDAPDDQRG